MVRVVVSRPDDFPSLYHPHDHPLARGPCYHDCGCYGGCNCWYGGGSPFEVLIPGSPPEAWQRQQHLEELCWSGIRILFLVGD